MKTTLPLLLIIALTQVLSAGETNAIKHYFLGLSPYYSPGERAEIERRIRTFALTAPRGSCIKIDDAFNLQTVTVFQVPELKFDSTANRMRAFAENIVALSQWFKKMNTNNAPAELANSALLRVPEYLDFIAADGSGQPHGIMLIGSPFAEYPTERPFSMSGAEESPRVPSDGHLLAGLQNSPYGTMERKGRLRGSQISWCYGSENVWSNALHKTLLTRFWVLFTKQEDATLVAFTPDLASAFATLPQAGRGAVANFDLNPEDTKIEMLVARPRQVPTWLAQAGAETNVASATHLQNQRSGSAARSGQSEIPTGVAQRTTPRPSEARRSPVDLTQPIAVTVDIGIMWESSDSQLDVDLYVRARPGAEELWYQKVRTQDGVYVRDWTQPNNRTDFEWVKLNPGVRLAEVEAWVNLFKGRGPISGRVAVHFENRTFLGSFTVPAASGNGGMDARIRQNSPHWTRLDLQKILTQNH